LTPPCHRNAAPSRLGPRGSVLASSPAGTAHPHSPDKSPAQHLLPPPGAPKAPAPLQNRTASTEPRDPREIPGSPHHPPVPRAPQAPTALSRSHDPHHLAAQPLWSARVKHRFALGASSQIALPLTTGQVPPGHATAVGRWSVVLRSSFFAGGSGKVVHRLSPLCLKAARVEEVEPACEALGNRLKPLLHCLRRRLYRSGNHRGEERSGSNGHEVRLHWLPVLRSSLAVQAM
jgi:hypothetical protein